MNGDPRNPVIAAAAAVLALIAVLLSAAPANAAQRIDAPINPICTTAVDQCQPGQAIYCPETGMFIRIFSLSCPSLWTPYGPGSPSDDD